MIFDKNRFIVIVVPNSTVVVVCVMFNILFQNIGIVIDKRHKVNPQQIINTSIQTYFLFIYFVRVIGTLPLSFSASTP